MINELEKVATQAILAQHTVCYSHLCCSFALVLQFCPRVTWKIHPFSANQTCIIFPVYDHQTNSHLLPIIIIILIIIKINISIALCLSSIFFETDFCWDTRVDRKRRIEIFLIIRWICWLVHCDIRHVDWRRIMLEWWPVYPVTRRRTREIWSLESFTRRRDR